MSDQLRLRRQIANLEAIQTQRVAMVAARKKQLDDIVERKAREIQNLKQRLTIGAVR